MRPSLITTPTPELPTRLSDRPSLAILLWALVACTPLRDLSSYSVEPASSAGVEGDTLGAVVGSPSAPAPLQAAGGSASGGDAGAPSAPPPSASDDGGVPTDAGTSVPACDGPDDVVSAAGGCYSFVADTASWAAASAACSAWGGALARIESSEEEAFLLEGTSGDTWLGLNDSETEGAMRWEGGVELGSFRNWAADQPDDFDGTEDCVELLADGRGWNDRPCTDLRVYVCERRAIDSLTQ